MYRPASDPRMYGSRLTRTNPMGGTMFSNMGGIGAPPPNPALTPQAPEAMPGQPPMGGALQLLSGLGAAGGKSPFGLPQPVHNVLGQMSPLYMLASALGSKRR